MKVAVKDDVTTVEGTTDVVVTGGQPPVVSAGADAALDEGGLYTGSGYFTAATGSGWSASADYGDGSGVQALLLNGQTFSLSHTYADNGIYTVIVTVENADGLSGSGTSTVTVSNVAPVVGEIAANSAARLSGRGQRQLQRCRRGDAPHTATWSWGDGQISAGQTTEDSGQGTASGSHTYAARACTRWV